MTAPDPRLGEIEGRLSKATPGPWYVEASGHGSDRIHIIDAIVRDPYGDNALSLGNDEALAAFIANAPADVAYLLAELRKAQDALGRVEGLMADPEHYDTQGPSNGYVSVDNIRAAVAAAAATGGES